VLESQNNIFSMGWYRGVILHETTFDACEGFGRRNNHHGSRPAWESFLDTTRHARPLYSIPSRGSVTNSIGRSGVQLFK
jgi:hypothetical protein